jgi:hypothetical protein
MTALLTFAAEHKAALGIAGAWVMREIPVAWGWLKSLKPAALSVYRWLGAEGGYKGVCNTLKNGKPAATAAQPAEKQ